VISHAPTACYLARSTFYVHCKDRLASNTCCHKRSIIVDFYIWCKHCFSKAAISMGPGVPKQETPATSMWTSSANTGRPKAVSQVLA
jgi:hypothetical protein